MSNNDIVLNFINGPLKLYLTTNLGLKNFVDLTNTECSTSLNINDLDTSFLANAKIVPQGEGDHALDCNWHYDWHACNCGHFDK